MTNHPAKRTLAEALRELVGRVLSSVGFVADYVQLGFDGPGMNAFTAPTVARGSESLSLGQPGYRDGLCGQIGHGVESTEVNDRQVSIIFDNQVTISISLRDDDYGGPEALEFSLAPNDQIWVV
jgi:hypothetical protein